MRTFITYLSYIGLMLAISLMANFAQAESEDLCGSELKPYYELVKQFDSSEAMRKQVLTQYHARRNSVYATCDRNKIRKYEDAYNQVMGSDGRSQLETLSYFPKARKTVDLGEY